MSDGLLTNHFLGAAGTVTGSKHLISFGGKNILVDCGLFQGLKELRLLNWKPLAFPANKIDIVLLTHAHLDHTGYLPMLVKQGFTGKIIGTAPTLQIAEIILRDSAMIQEEDAVRANKHQYSKHHAALPLYTLKDVEKVIPLFSHTPLNEWIQFDEKIQYRFRYNGHIIGATFIELMIGAKTIVFSEDVGRPIDPLLYPPEKPENASILFIEATYGNRIHSPLPAMDILEQSINQWAKRNGTVIIPSFAIERTQLLMFLFWELRKAAKIPGIPIYLDSPMADRAFDVFKKNPSWHKLSPEDCSAMQAEIRIISSKEERRALETADQAKIIIAGSGMATGGRVLHYLATYLGDESATIAMVGFQAEGTRGRLLLDGVKEVKLYGKYFKVRAHIENIEGFSGHADQNELIKWMSALKIAPEKVFIVHAEPESALALSRRIEEVYQCIPEIPALNDVSMVDISP